jgi:hypothetical protein
VVLSSSVIGVGRRVSFGIFGAGVVGVALGVAVWFAGYGTGPLIAVSIVLGSLLAARNQPLPRAITAVVVWSLLAWFAGPLALRVLPLGYVFTTGCLVLLAASPIPIGVVIGRLGAGQQSVAREQAREVFRPERVPAMLAGTILVVLLAAAACLRFGFAGVAWAMSGDARNHALATALVYPPDFSGMGVLRDPTSAFFGFMTVAAANPDKAGLDTVELVRLSIVGIFSVTLLAVCLVSVAGALLLMQFGALLRRYSLWPVAGASLSATTGIGASVALMDGFTTALLASAIIGFGLVAAVSFVGPEARGRNHAIDAATVFASFALTAATWTYAAAGLVLVVALVAVRAWRRWSVRGRLVLLGLAIVTAAVAAQLLPGWIRLIRDQDAFGLFGAIIAPNPMWLVFVPAVVAATVLVHGARRLRTAVLPYAAGYVGALVLVAIMVYMPEGPPQWFYYASKLTWTWTAATVALLFLPLLVLSERAGVARSALRSAPTGVAIASIAVVLLIRSLSPMDSPIWTFDPVSRDIRSTLAQGWNAPNAGAVDALLAALQVDGPSVVWSVTDAGNDRLANFWLEIDPSTLEVNTADGFRDWAYSQTAEMGSLCDLLGRNHDRTVVTRDPGLSEKIASSCRISPPNIVLVS